jgi:hypothetical protein
MLNEGLHVNEVNGVILLRPTVSPIIFYQQIGRCLKVGMDKTPVIFDLVNNFNSIHSKDFLYDLEFARTSYFNERKETELSIRCPEFTVQDETREITELFGSIAFQLTAWEEIYDRMKTFFKLNGHCRPAPSNCSDEQLMYWVTRQRKKYNNGLLSADRIQKLNAINFDWNYHQNNWDIMFNELASYRSAHGHCRIPSHTKNVSKLASWVLTQRKDYREGKISPERIKRLEQLNFSWNPMEEDFNKMFRLFESYIEEYGNCRVNYKTHKKLFSWLSSRRADFRLNRLSKEKVERLNALDSKWSIDYSEELWNNNFMELMEYHEEFGHCDASATQRKYASLGAWVSDQRTKYRKGELSHEQIKKLEALNFRWNPVQERWDEMYGKLKQYHFEHGNCLVKSSFDNELASFVLKNRKALKNGELSEERKKLLKEIDFELDGLMAKWELRYAQLLEYKEKYGDCNVSQGYKENSKLATWVTLQIKKFNKKILGEYHLRKLTEAGFDFECKLLSKRIDTYLYQLSQYKKQHGNINIPATWNETIYGWLSKERRKYKDGKSAPAISSALEQLGVIWETKDYHWGNMFRLLMDFKKENGHTDVTSLNNDNKQFVEWVRNMRSARKRGILPLHKLNALGQTGFLWETLHWDKEWNRRLEVLRAYYERHGDLNTRYTKGKIDKKASCLIFSLRKSFKEGKLSSSQIEQLRAMDFTFDLEEKARGHWFEMFELLKQFKSKYGHCAVPEAWKKNRALAQWARLQRKRKEDKKLHNEFIDLLNKEGFLWDPMEGRYDRKTRG